MLWIHLQLAGDIVQFRPNFIVHDKFFINMNKANFWSEICLPNHLFLLLMH